MEYNQHADTHDEARRQTIADALVPSASICLLVYILSFHASTL